MTKIIFQLFTDIWHLARKYEFAVLTEEQWIKFCETGEELLNKYRKYDAAIEQLYRDLFRAVQAYYQAKGTDK